MWSETDGLSYMLLTCSSCATRCRDERAPLIGVRVVGYSRPSLKDRLNQVSADVQLYGLVDVSHILIRFHLISGLSSTVNC